MNDATYRYRLARSWSFGHGRLVWVMLNPSTADEHTDDPTVRRVVRFTQDALYQSLDVVNLFACRATDPRELLGLASLGLDVRGPQNNLEVTKAIAGASAVVFAWGSSCPPQLRRMAVAQIRHVLRVCAEHFQMPLCLGINADAQPKHPLYIKTTEPLRPYPIPEALRVR